MLLTLTERPTYLRIKQFFPWLGMGLCLSALAAHLAWDIVGWRTSAAVAQADIQRAQAAVSQQTAAANPPTTVVLSEAKLKAAKLTTAQARYDELPTELGVPARSMPFLVRTSSVVIHSSPWIVPTWERAGSTSGPSSAN